MCDPFATALDALFNAPGSVAAVYYPTIGRPVAVRLIRSQPDEISRYGDAQIIQATNVFQVRRSEIDEPVTRAIIMPGATIVDCVVQGDEQLLIRGDAQLDVEGLTWTFGAEPA